MFFMKRLNCGSVLCQTKWLSHAYAPFFTNPKQFLSSANVEAPPPQAGIKPWEQPKGYDTGFTVANCYASLGNYNSRSVVPLIVKDPENITWYSCGPTVYDDAHIGHASTYVRFDALRRALTNFYDFNVKMVMGITDVDNKLITRSQLLGKEMWSIAQQYEMEFQRDMCLLNVLPPHRYMRVSDFIPEMIMFVEKLLDMGNAYKTQNGDVWFDTDKFTNVGRLSRMFEEYETQLVEKVKKTKSKRDFALWKSAKPGEPYWDAPWGKGRPGWHLECSVMGSLMFGDNLDIHSGGRDLCFPHHECELLQSEAFHGCNQWVNYFLHSGQLKLEGSDAKMSKSIGNTILVSDFLEEHSSDIFRYLVLSSPWFQDISYSGYDISKAKTRIAQTCQTLTKCQNYIDNGDNSNIDSALVLKHLSETKNASYEMLRQNFNTKSFLFHLRDLERKLEEAFKMKNHSDHQVPKENDCIHKALTFIENAYQKIGFINLKSKAHQSKTVKHESLKSNIEFSETVRELAKSNTHQPQSLNLELLKPNMEFRETVRDLAKQMLKSENKEVKEKGIELLNGSDKLRHELSKQGVQIADTVTGCEWTYDENASVTN